LIGRCAGVFWGVFGFKKVNFGEVKNGMAARIDALVDISQNSAVLPPLNWYQIKGAASPTHSRKRTEHNISFEIGYFPYDGGRIGLPPPH